MRHLLLGRGGVIRKMLAAQVESANVWQAQIPYNAVLVVGPIDGVDGTWTKAEIEHSNWLADALEEYGVKVTRFYPPNDNWEDIEIAAEGAMFFQYRGHGLEDGGFTLTSGYVAPRQISQLHLAAGAVAMVYACYAAGSTLDEEPVTSGVAVTRVEAYSAPFFRAGATAYYAAWRSNAFSAMVRDLFTGYTYLGAFLKYLVGSDRYTAMEVIDGKVYLIPHNYFGEYFYDYAFVGDGGGKLSRYAIYIPDV